MDWEAWFRSAAEPPSDNEDDKRDRTYREIKLALSNHDALKGKNYIVYTKGSYANGTNVRLNYDVDIAVEYQGFMFFDLFFDLKDSNRDDLGIEPTTDTYSTDDFKKDIKDALIAAFGSSSIEDGNIAYRVRNSSTTLPADVVPCWDYRRYEELDGAGKPVGPRGSCIWPKSGSKITNFPDQQLTNGTDKNIATGYRYKRMVRVLKKLQTRLVDEGLLTSELPSYAIECLVYNVADEGFNISDKYADDVRYILATIANDTRTEVACSEWLEVSRLKYMFKSKLCGFKDANSLANAAWSHVGFE
jgi:hypothetical protein